MRTFGLLRTSRASSLRFVGNGKLDTSRWRFVTLRKGEMSFYQAGLIHGSDVNRGTVPRLSSALHMEDESNRWPTTT